MILDPCKVHPFAKKCIDESKLAGLKEMFVQVLTMAKDSEVPALCRVRYLESDLSF
jgi:hypothetical protein